MNLMKHYPSPATVREVAETEGLLQANNLLEETMKNSAEIKAEEIFEELQRKNLDHVSDYGQRFINDYLIPLSESIVKENRKGLIASYLDTKNSEENLVNYRARTLSYLVLVSILGMNKEEETKATAKIIKLGKKVFDLAVEYHRTQAHFKNESVTTFEEIPSDLCYSNYKDLIYTETKPKLLASGARILEQMNLTEKQLETEELAKTGASLYYKSVEITNAINIESVKNPTRYIITVTEDLRYRERDSRAQLVQNATEFRPMLIKPYLMSMDCTLAYKTRSLRKALVTGYSGKFTADKLPEKVRMAINKMQGTAFNINEKVFNYLEKCMKENKYIKKFWVEVPALFSEDKPNWEEDKEGYRKWKTSKNKNEEDRKEAITINDASERAMAIAKYYKEIGLPFYLPVYCDYRFRMYYKPTGLNPQASKPIKALFEFANKEKIGSMENMDLFFISYANTLEEVEYKMSDRDILKEIGEMR